MTCVTVRATFESTFVSASIIPFNSMPLQHADCMYASAATAAAACVYTAAAAAAAAARNTEQKQQQQQAAAKQQAAGRHSLKWSHVTSRPSNCLRNVDRTSYRFYLHRIVWCDSSFSSSLQPLPNTNAVQMHIRGVQFNVLRKSKPQSVPLCARIVAPGMTCGRSRWGCHDDP